MLCRIPVVRIRAIAKCSPICCIQRSKIAGKDPIPRLTLSSPPYALYPSETHCFIGLNGSGKTQLVTRMVADTLSKRTANTQSETDRLHVGLHNLKEQLSLVRRYREDFVSNVLGGVSSSDAKDLIVRFGLYGLWSSKVKHLSTGEIRKLMLARLLVLNPRPNVIFLDQPFDGLDENGKKQVEWMMTQLTRGFSRLLIDTGGKNKAFAYKTQIVVIVSCLQYIPIDITTHAILVGKQTDEKHPNVRVFPNDKTPSGKKALLECVESFLWEESLAQGHVSRRSEDGIQRALGFLYKEQSVLPENDPILTLENMSFAHRKNEFLLENVSFQRLPREHWVLLGPNGSGKSSLTRLMLSESLREKIHNGKLCVNLLTGEENKIRVISTDTHVNLLEEAFRTKTTKSSKDLILSDAVSQEHGMVAANLLGISEEILSRPFLTLSHGEQKLVLIAQALASAPRVLIFDEVTHGLDDYNRNHVLQIIENMSRIVPKKTLVHLIMITHRIDEITACFQPHIYSIQKRKLVPGNKAIHSH